jgi:predicted Zn-dependent peptidase
MKMLRIVALLVTILMFAAPDIGSAAGAKPASGVVKKVLENGLTILVKESKANEIVSMQLFSRMGAKHESDEEAGVSRLLQQSMLKGTENRTAEDIATEIESVGGRIESGTTKETGYIQLTCTTEGFSKAREVFFDVVLNPVFPPDEVEKEKELVIKKIKERKDRLILNAIDMVQEELYGKHPFHKPGEGYEETVGSFGREQVSDAYRRFYSPENMVIAAVGNLDGDAFIADVEKHLGQMTAASVRPSVTMPEISLTEPREKLKYRESSSVWLVIAYPTPGVMEDGYLSAHVLNSILGGSMNSRLFTELRDKRGLGYSVGSFYAGYSSDAFVGAYIGTKPGQFEIARDGILGESAKLREEEVTDEELESAKTYLRGSYMIRLESNANQAYDFAYYECVGAGYAYPDRYLEGLLSVSKDDVMKAAKTYFNTYALASVLPEVVETDESGAEKSAKDY